MMNENDVVEIISQMQDRGIDIFLDGGWGVDALLGEQTRDHDDLDIFVEEKHGDTVVGILQQNGYRETKKEYTTDSHTVWQDPENRIVDLHLFSFGSDGSYIFHGESFAADTFEAVGSIAGKKIRCIKPEYQVVFHLGYEHDENDEHDVRMLCDHFKLQLPPEYR